MKQAVIWVRETPAVPLAGGGEIPAAKCVPAGLIQRCRAQLAILRSVTRRHLRMVRQRELDQLEDSLWQLLRRHYRECPQYWGYPGGPVARKGGPVPDCGFTPEESAALLELTSVLVFCLDRLDRGHFPRQELERLSILRPPPAG